MPVAPPTIRTDPKLPLCVRGSRRDSADGRVVVEQTPSASQGCGSASGPVGCQRRGVGHRIDAEVGDLERAHVSRAAPVCSPALSQIIVTVRAARTARRQARPRSQPSVGVDPAGCVDRQHRCVGCGQPRTPRARSRRAAVVPGRCRTGRRLQAGARRACSADRRASRCARRSRASVGAHWKRPLRLAAVEANSARTANPRSCSIISARSASPPLLPGPTSATTGVARGSVRARRSAEAATAPAARRISVPAGRTAIQAASMRRIVREIE